MTRTFADGLGRISLTQKPAVVNGAATGQAVASFYDARGLLVKETLPYAMTPPANDQADPVSRDTNQPGATHSYDVFGERTLTTRADGTQTQVTSLPAQHQTYTAERGVLFAIGNHNPRFEWSGGSGACAPPQGWTVIGSGACAERAWGGAEGRFSLRLASGGATATVSAVVGGYGNSGLGNGSLLTLSWLARRTAGAGKIRPFVSIDNNPGVEPVSGAVYGFVDLDASAGQGWTLYHAVFKMPSGGNQLKIGFDVEANTTVYIDDLRMSWGEARERRETTDELGRRSQVAERTGLATRVTTDYHSDALDRQVGIDHPAVAGQARPTTTSTYSDRFRRLTIVDPDQGTLQVRYDPNGNLVKQQDGRGQVIERCYDSLDRLTRTYYNGTDLNVTNCASLPNSYAARWVYDDTSVGPNQVGRRSWLYNSTDLNNEYVKYEYDARGRVTTETRRIASWNYPTSYSYDTANQVRSMTYPDGEVVTTGYDAAGQVTSVGGTNSYLTSQTYDVMGRPLDVTLGNGAISHSTYDATSQRLSELRTDAQEGVWTGYQYIYVPYTEARRLYGYDAFGNVTAINTYDRYGSLVAGDSQTFAYDALNRLTAVGGSLAQSFGYDDQGNLTARDGQSYTYSATKPHAVRRLGVDGVTDRFDYDGAGNMTGRGCYQLAVYPAPWVCRQGLAYDAEGRLSTLSDGSLGSETYRYDGDGALTRRTITPATVTTPFNEGFTTATLNSAAWTTVGSVAGAQPGGGSHTSIASLAASAEAYRKATVGDGQVVRVAFRVGSNTAGASLGLEVGDWASGTYHRFGVWQRDGQLLVHLFRNSQEIRRTVLLPSVAINEWYILELAVDDGAGFRVSAWQESQPGTRYEMRYEMPSGQSWRFHAWSGSAASGLDDYSEATLSLGPSDARIVGKHYEYDSASNTQTKRYYANGALLATRSIPNANPGAQTLRYVQPDHLGSTTTLTDEWGVVVSRERYSAFGERRRTSDKVLTDQLYTGQRLNVLSNLYHYSDGTSAGRFYDPLLGRFVMADPLLPHLASQGLNRYAANYNNPLRYKDPNGHDPSDVVNGLNEFAMGVVAQVSYNNNTLFPAAQARVAPQPGESAAMTAGRVVGDVVSIGEAAAAAVGGAGIISGGVAGGAAVCAGSAGAACAAGVVGGGAVAAAGAGVIAVGGTIAVNAGSHMGQTLNSVMVGGQQDENATFRFSSRSLQRKFKHATDFDVEGSYSKENARKFEAALRQHVSASSTQVIEGTYRGDPVRHYFDPTTGRNVMFDLDGNFISGWKLSEDQAKYLTTTGNLQ